MQAPAGTALRNTQNQPPNKMRPMQNMHGVPNNAHEAQIRLAERMVAGAPVARGMPHGMPVDQSAVSPFSKS